MNIHMGANKMNAALGSVTHEVLIEVLTDEILKRVAK
jgi:hypothetical protein